jgi:hypothetical protein
MTTTYENYCRERKAVLNRERAQGRRSNSSEIVDGILEVISGDQSPTEQAATYTSTMTTQTSASWSLSSNTIVTAWPSWNSEDDDEGAHTVQKSIQSYTSQLFSPLYEVTMDQHNVFQENRRPLPKAGQTPKFGNLCYSLLTQLSDDQNLPEHNSEWPDAYEPVIPSSKVSATAALSPAKKSYEPLLSMTSTKVTTRFAKATKRISSPTNTMLPLNKLDKKAIEYARMHFERRSLPEKYDYDVYARNDWTLESLTSSGSGELSLEPLLEAFAAETPPFEFMDTAPLDEDEGSSDGQVKKEAEKDNAVTLSVKNESASEHKIDGGSLDAQVQNAGKDNAVTSRVENESTSDHTIISVVEPAPERFVNDMLHKSFTSLCRITLDAMVTPSLFHAIDTSQLPLRPLFTQSRHSSNPLRDFVLGQETVKNQDKNCCEIVSMVPPSSKALTYLLGDQRNCQLTVQSLSCPSSEADSSCFMLDPEAFCIRLSNWRQTRTKQGALPEDSESINDEIEHLIAPHNDGLVRDCALDTTKLSLLFSSTSEDITDSQTPHSASNEIFDDDDRVVLHPSALSLIASGEGAGISVNTDVLLKDDELRAVMKLTNDGEDASTLFPSFTYDSSIACESDDGLVDELGALELFGDDLRKTLDIAMAAVDSTLLPPLTSPIQTPVPTLSSDSSMANFADVHDVSPNYSGDGRRSTPFVRRVHFNDEVQEFLFVNEIGDEPRRGNEADDTFLDEVMGVFEDLLDELSFACVSASRAIDKTRAMNKEGKVRRSSAY